MEQPSEWVWCTCMPLGDDTIGTDCRAYCHRTVCGSVSPNKIDRGRVLATYIFRRRHSRQAFVVEMRRDAAESFDFPEEPSVPGLGPAEAWKV